jgi:hypothetical protein
LVPVAEGRHDLPARTTSAALLRGGRNTSTLPAPALPDTLVVIWQYPQRPAKRRFFWVWPSTSGGIPCKWLFRIA